MRHLMLLAGLVALSASLGAATLGDMSFEKAMSTGHTRRAANLFDTATTTTPAAVDRFMNSALLEEGRESGDQMFGAGATLGLNTAAIGITFGGFFDFYFTPWIAADVFTSVSYGFLGRPEHNGGDALAVTLSLGAKFVLDFEDLEWTEWFRPFAVFYPVGLAYLSATEDADEPGTGNTRDVKYSDLYFLMAGGIGSDFYLTNMIGLGFGLYIYGTIGGSKHKHSRGIETKTSGAVGVYFEYVRFTVRF
ncbi:MAG: hypothetical protein H6839_12565 [Planctomycetes bacterium]|nr:hypothetical protein [Planctomycetota bacterium]